MYIKKFAFDQNEFEPMIFKDSLAVFKSRSNSFKQGEPTKIARF